LTVSPVAVEACHFLNIRGKVELLKWIEKGGLSVAELPMDAYPALAVNLEKYADLDIDLADAALIWLAETGRRVPDSDGGSTGLWRVSDERAKTVRSCAVVPPLIDSNPRRVDPCRTAR